MISLFQKEAEELTCSFRHSLKHGRRPWQFV